VDRARRVIRITSYEVRMFLAIYGATGTGKDTILDLLTRRGYEYFQCKPIEPTDSPFNDQLAYQVERTRVHLEAQKVANRRDVVTVHTPYDTNAVFGQMLFNQERITQQEFSYLNLIVHGINPALEPPHAAIHCFTSAMTAMNRLALRSKDIDQNSFNAQLELYKTFAQRVRIPQIECDFDQPMETIQKDFDFNIASLKTTTVTNQTLWRREMFRDNE
jgi:deoxyadenosine/deoxycytidine kinase